MAPARNRPEMGIPARTRSAGSAASKAGQSVAIIIAVRWPPAEWPMTIIFSGEKPRSSAWCQHQATRLSDLRGDLPDANRRSQVVVQHRHRHAVLDEALGGRSCTWDLSPRCQ